MSFAFMRLYTGDYLRDTRHLTPQKHGVYLLLLMHCWDQKGPVPLDEQEAAGVANCRSADEIDALRYVLGKFFTKCDDGWYNKRMAEEIANAAQYSSSLRQAGLKSAEVRRARSLIRKKDKGRLNQGLTKAEPRSVSSSPSSALEPTPKKRTPPTPSFALPDWVPAQSWADWEQMRVKKRKPLTDAARAINLRKLDVLRKDGSPPKPVIEQSIAHGWDTFYPVKLSELAPADLPPGFDSYGPVES